MKPNTFDSQIAINKIVRDDRGTRAAFDTIIVSSNIDQLSISININTENYISFELLQTLQILYERFVEQLGNLVSAALSIADNIIILISNTTVVFCGNTPKILSSCGAKNNDLSYDDNYLLR